MSERELRLVLNWLGTLTGGWSLALGAILFEDRGMWAGLIMVVLGAAVSLMCLDGMIDLADKVAALLDRWTKKLERR